MDAKQITFNVSWINQIFKFWFLYLFILPHLQIPILFAFCTNKTIQINFTWKSFRIPPTQSEREGSCCRCQIYLLSWQISSSWSILKQSVQDTPKVSLNTFKAIFGIKGIHKRLTLGAKESIGYKFDSVLWHLNHCRLFNAKSIFIHINRFISKNSV